MATDNIIKECTEQLTKDTILSRAERDGERPMGFLLTYLRDNYSLPKTSGWSIAEKILERFGIDNMADYPWLKH